MQSRKTILGFGLTAVAALAMPARAQDTPPTATPTPGAIPGVLPERFNLGPPVTATPVPLPSPTPTSAPPRPTPTPAAERPAPQPQASATPASPVPAPVASPTTLPGATPTPVPAPIATAPAATASATPVAAPAPAPQPAQGGLPIWLWALVGAGLAALAFAAYRLLRVAPVEAPEPIAETAAEAPPPVLPPRARPAPVPAAPMPPATTDPFELLLQPQRIALSAHEVVLELELLVGNRQGQGAEGIRLQVLPLSANPDQDRQLAAFHAGPFVDSGAPAFDLPAGGGGRMPVRIALPRDRLHVVQVGNRPMFVPMVLIDLRWRAGLGLKRFGMDFMLGTAGQGGKLGPIWLDRPPAGTLAATRYTPRASTADAA